MVAWCGRRRLEQGGGFIRLGVGRGGGRRLEFRGAGRRRWLGRRSLGRFCLSGLRRGRSGILVSLALLGDLVGERPARGDGLTERAVPARRTIRSDLSGGRVAGTRPGRAGLSHSGFPPKNIVKGQEWEMRIN